MQHSPDTLIDLLTYQAETRPDATALVWQHQDISYGELSRNVHRFAAQCTARYRPGQRIGILAWNCPEFVSLLYAVPAAGQVLVPLNARLAGAELSDQIRDAGITVLFGHGKLLHKVPASPELERITLERDLLRWLSAPAPMRSDNLSTQTDSPAWVLFTSGTTGRAKGATLTHRSLLAGLASAAHGRPVHSDDRYLYPFPLFHIAAHNVLLQHQHGAGVILLRSFDAATVLDACRKHRVTTMSLAPTMLSMLLDHPQFTPDALSSVRSVGYGASAISEALLKQLLQETTIALSQGYGMTELSGNVTFLDADAHRRGMTHAPHLLKSVGKPVPGVQIRLDGAANSTKDASGEILVRGDQVMQGYWGQSEATARTLIDGWLHTGDIGRFDSDGYLYIIDRKKDMIITGGENVASREVEAILEQYAGVRQAAVVGIGDETWGERICAMVVAAAGHQTDTQVLQSYCRRYLAGYKTPTCFVFADTLPLNAAGKVDKPAIRERFKQEGGTRPVT